ncbi:LINE-1 retrotransposable element ORF2 protein [Dictyocoela muelleri]|nr:LINE-1 retrotransposable element ORF2 protein [Dictyocoela muelleri]
MQGFGRTKRKNNKKNNLPPKPSKNTVSLNKNTKTNTNNCQDSLLTNTLNIKDENSQLIHKNSITNTNEIINENLENVKNMKNSYRILPIEAIKIFYDVTKGKERASSSEWQKIYSEFKTKFNHYNMKQSTFKNYLNYTKLLHEKKNEINLDELNIISSKIESKSNIKDNNKEKDKSFIEKENNINIIKNENNENIIKNENNENFIKNENNENFIKNENNESSKNNNKTIKDESEKEIKYKNKGEIKGEIKGFMKRDMTDDRYNIVREKFNQNYQEIIKTEYEIRKRTFKIPHIKCDYILINTLNNIVNEFMNISNDIGIVEIIDLVYCAQVTYDSIKVKKYTKNESHETKLLKYDQSIANKNHELNIIDNVISNNKLNNKDKKSFQQLSKRYKLKNKGEEYKIFKSKTEQDITIINKRKSLYIKRREYNKNNYLFELNRKAFYRNLNNEKIINNVDNEESLKDYWMNMWNKENNDKSDSIFKFIDFNIENKNEDVSIPFESFKKTLESLHNWKAPGFDLIYAFWIKAMTKIHEKLYNIYLKYLYEPEIIPEILFIGNTHLIPKAETGKVEDFRPITCLSNFYKVLTKILKDKLWHHIESNQIISINQAGAMKNIQGAKEQYLINQSIISLSNTKIYTSWFDVKKAFDSIDQDYLLKLLEKIEIPQKIMKFLKMCLSKWSTKILYKGKSLGKTSIKRGILQGDSLSPLLYVIAMEPISRFINQNDKSTPNIMVGDKYININHLFYIDDLKLFSTNIKDLENLKLTVIHAFKSIGLSINENKSEDSVNLAQNELLMDRKAVYKYLGINECYKNTPNTDEKERIKNTAYERITKLSNTPLNSHNLIKSINEYSLSIFNYYTGIIFNNETDGSLIDKNIRKLLVDNKLHYKNASNERIYLPRNLLGRGIKSIEMNMEKSLYNLSDYISRETDRSKIIKEGMLFSSKSRIIKYKDILKNKYNTSIDDIKALNKLQIQYLFNKNKNKEIHGLFYKNIEEQKLNFECGSKWLMIGNHNPRQEAINFLIQDRNFNFSNRKCFGCGSVKFSIDHIATKCVKLLHTHYLARHNEIVKAIHLNLCKRYGFTDSKKIKNHKMEKILKNNNAEIFSEVTLKSDIRIKNNKPDLLVKDKRNNMIYIIDIGISSISNIKSYEIEKIEKYKILARELMILEKCDVQIVPYIVSWDGFCTEYNEKYRRMIDIKNKLHAFIQNKCMNMTFEIMMNKNLMIYKSDDK